MKNSLKVTNQNAELALSKSKSLLNITNGLLSQKASSILNEKFQFKPYFSDGHTDSVFSLAITPNGEYIVSGGGDKTIKLWDINSGKCIKTLDSHDNEINSVVVTPNGKTIISGSSDKTIKLWDINSGKCIKTLTGHDNEINSVVVTQNGEYIVSGGGDIFEEYINHGEIEFNRYAEIKIWEIESGKCINTLEQDTVRDSSIVDLILDSDIIFSGSSDGTIKLFSLDTEEYIASLSENYSNGYMYSLIITPDKKTIIICNSHKTIELWDINNNKYLKSLKGHTDSVYSLAITPDGKTIISGSSDKTIKLWDINSGKCIKTLDGHSENVSKLEDGAYFYTIKDGSTITMFENGYFNASKENIDKFIRINDTPLSSRKLTKEEIEHFCKIKYDSFDINEDVYNKSQILNTNIDEDDIPF